MLILFYKLASHNFKRHGCINWGWGADLVSPSFQAAWSCLRGILVRIRAYSRTSLSLVFGIIRSRLMEEDQEGLMVEARTSTGKQSERELFTSQPARNYGDRLFSLVISGLHSRRCTSLHPERILVVFVLSLSTRAVKFCVHTFFLTTARLDGAISPNHPNGDGGCLFCIV